MILKLMILLIALSSFIALIEIFLRAKVEEIRNVVVLEKITEYITISNYMKKILILFSIFPIFIMIGIFSWVMSMENTSIMDGLKSAVIVLPLLAYGIVNLVYIFVYNKDQLKNGDEIFKIKCHLDGEERVIECSEKIFLKAGPSITCRRHTRYMLKKPLYSIKD